MTAVLEPNEYPRRIVPVYWEVRFPVSATDHLATYQPKGPTRFTRIVGNVTEDGVELASLEVGRQEQVGAIARHHQSQQVVDEFRCLIAFHAAPPKRK